ncbi:NIPSNAP family protein [Flavobacterium sp.]|uniref:NIPSNAP family protein n=1 Tax=Flavobacterium sp. TaxID=239 RepID=UPI00286F1CF1|nr:NIPSNAP family protein [Flavobacterium sp.]
MKTIKTLLYCFAIVVISYNSAAQKRELYQIKTYNLKSESQLTVTENFLKDAYLPALKRIGIKAVGVFKPKTFAADSIKKIVVVIPFASSKQFLQLENKLAKDQEYLTIGSPYLDAAYNQAPYVRIESVVLQAFTDHPLLTLPQLDRPRANRVYELRSYESATEAIYRRKVDMFNAGGEIKLFQRLQFNAVFYGEVLSGGKMPNLMYLTTFANQESRDNHWKAFVDSPEWKSLIAMDKYKNTISHIDILFLYPTDYSDY